MCRDRRWNDESASICANTVQFVRSWAQASTYQVSSTGSLTCGTLTGANFQRYWSVFQFSQTPGCKLNLFSCQSYLMPCQQSLRTSRKCMLHDVIWICLKTATDSCENTLELGAKIYEKDSWLMESQVSFPCFRPSSRPGPSCHSDPFQTSRRWCLRDERAKCWKGMFWEKWLGLYSNAWNLPGPVIIYIYIEFLSTDEFFKSCAEISGSHHHHLPVHVRRPGRPKEMLRMPILSSFWMCKNLAKSNPKSAVHPFPSNGNGRTVWIFGMPHSQMILHGVSRALGRDVGCLKPKKASCAELPAAKR